MFYHLTSTNRGKVARFDPNVPETGMREDTVTPRLCLARSIEDAIAGLTNGQDASAIDAETLYVYAIDNVPNLVVPRSEETPEQRQAIRDLQAFNDKWDLDVVELDKLYNDPVWVAAYKKEWKALNDKAEQTSLYFVEDAAQTGEVWSLSSLQMTLIGKLMWNPKRKRYEQFAVETFRLSIRELRQLIQESLQFPTVRQRPAHYEVVNYYPEKVKVDLISKIGGLKNANFLRDGYRDSSFVAARRDRDAGKVYPVTVDIWGDSVSLTDGRHRLAIALERGDSTIIAHVRQRSERTGDVIASVVSTVPTGI